MALDQVHEQNDTIIKGTGGASHLLNRPDESPLLRWEFCSSLKNKHHEDNSSFGKRFNKNVKRVCAAFSENPSLFGDITLTAVKNKKIIFNEEVSVSHRPLS